MKDNVYWHSGNVDRNARQQRNKHKSFVLWFTGLSGSGKSTLANAIERKLFDAKHNVMVLDGDNVRHGLLRGGGADPRACESDGWGACVCPFRGHPKKLTGSHGARAHGHLVRLC